ncbi:threonine-phosphate decarboxylase [Jannaschia donghaensis]|uniref:Aminotransferase n=1 Tax=Jannaschia donghaensis TaxID=420998 RepID=A0A0M6YJN5_9RHOB|nr:threonine-phosphate decarboxylase [Jannaschia donghaensis]CTQ49875.1 Threonine-phosphate decarboxylase [Jannaschia donghaensis]
MPDRDHGGGLDAARARWGGPPEDWLDLSTGINPVAYPLPEIPLSDWTALPDTGAMDRLLGAARTFWDVPDGAALLAAPGTSALIARVPVLAPHGPVRIAGPTYNEHAAAFSQAGFQVVTNGPAATQVVVHPNNPDGRDGHSHFDETQFNVIDESFFDVGGYRPFTDRATSPGTIVLRGIGKFWGLAGLRLGFAIGHPDMIAPLRDAIGPWPVSGPALRIGAAALSDPGWADAARTRLAADAKRLDALMAPHGHVVGGTTLFRLYDVDDAATFQDRLARARIWSRIFPYSTRWLRLGLPHPDRWTQLEEALT